MEFSQRLFKEVLGKEVDRTKTVENTENIETRYLLLFIYYFITCSLCFLNRDQVTIDGDVEPNLGPCHFIQRYHASNGAFYGTVLLKYKIYKQCHCKAYKDLVEIQELGFDVSFLKLSQLLADGDIKSNPGPVTGTPKGRKANSVIQVLYSVDSFREHICVLNTHDPVVLIIKEFFKQSECSNCPTETYQYVLSLELPNYDSTRRQQFDAQTI